MNIILIGMSGSGKSTIGENISKKLNMSFYDIDDIIVSEEKRSIDNIFKEDGEPYFRKLECDVIERYSKMDNSVISTGGGAVLNKVNIDNLKKHGQIIFLEAEMDTLIRNLENSNIIRPLLKDKEKQKSDITKMYQDRKHLYHGYTDYLINVDNKSVDDISGEIIDDLKI